MTKTRHDDEVWHKPYLAGLIGKGRLLSAQALFDIADLPVDDFYKQLAWEIRENHLRDVGESLKAV